MSLNRRQFIRLAGLGMGGLLLAPQDALASEEPDSENAFAMLYDTTRCIGCRACQTACREWNGTPDELDPSGLYDAPLELSADTWTLIQRYDGEDAQSYVKHQCMHCLHPACVSVCPVGALQKTDEGPVTYDPKRCIGCRYCMVACPFQIPRFSWDETFSVVAKCTFCNDRLAVGDGPACVEACPADALTWGRRGDLLAEAERRMAEHPDRYVDKIYGQFDAGGTSALYLSHVGFENLGFPDIGEEPVPELSEKTSDILLPSLVAGVPIALAGLYYLVAKRQPGHEEE